MTQLDLDLQKQRAVAQEELVRVTSEMKDYKFKYEDLREQYTTLHAGEQMNTQDREHAESQYNSMRDKFLRLQRDKAIQSEQWQQEKEELKLTIQELKTSQTHLKEPAELIQKQSRDYLREKNAEIFDALIAQERLTEKYKYELKKTASAYEDECKKNDGLRKVRHEMGLEIQKQM